METLKSKQFNLEFMIQIGRKNQHEKFYSFSFRRSCYCQPKHAMCKKVRDQQNEQFAYFSTHPKKKDFIVLTAVLGSH